ncbi:MAG: metal-dependent transcriptional regulator [Actinobacteria bacterium]|nr:metal-dependent transcriptional regulator [Actinomycetota bacterium]
MPEECDPAGKGLPELPETTESEEMYLITVARAAEEGASGPIPVAFVAGSLGVSVVSANEKVHRLAGRGLVEYSPYKGVELTSQGADVARRVLRTRRLWATFLASRLGYSPAEADALACRLEHATPPDAAERLAVFLGGPRTGPQGLAIPPPIGEAAPATLPLAEIPAGTEVEVVALGVTGEPERFLMAHSLRPGCRVTVLAAGPSGLLVEAGGRSVHLAPGLGAAIEVVGGGTRVGG